jgi:SPX domain protein involved in polyphosphate accumulation
MKFGKWLKRQIEQSLPEWQDKFLRYKELKRCVNATAAAGRPPTPEEEAGFVSPLDAEIEKINVFFLDQEEEFVIRLWQLQVEIRCVVAVRNEVEAAATMHREIVNFHGEMVLLLNYSNINYIGKVISSAGGHDT